MTGPCVVDENCRGSPGSQEENRVVFSASSIEKSVRDALKEQGKSTGTRWGAFAARAQSDERRRDH